MKYFNELVKNITEKLLHESPFYVGEKSLYIDLNNEEANKNEFETVMQSNPTNLNSFKGYEVYRSIDRRTKHNTFYFINKDKIEALIGVEEKDSVGYSKVIAKRNTTENKTLIQDIFLNYFPTIYSSVVSDEYMNNLGKNFWKKLLDLAIARNYFVKVLISNTGEEKNYIPEEFESYWNNKTDPIIRRPSPTRMLFKIYFK